MGQFNYEKILPTLMTPEIMNAIPITLTASATRIMHTVTAEAGPGGSITPAGSVSVGDGDAVHTITVMPGAHGTITPGGPLTVNDGGSATFKIAAKRGYAIADVKVDGVSVGAVGTYTFQGVTEDHEIAAFYAYVGANPQTGDNTPIAVLLSVLALSLVGIVAVAYVRRGYSVAPARVRRPRG